MVKVKKNIGRTIQKMNERVKKQLSRNLEKEIAYNIN